MAAVVALLSPLVWSSGIELGRAHANTPKLWEKCEFPKNSVLGPTTKVLEMLEARKHRLRWVFIDDERLAPIMVLWNSLPPKSEHEADKLLIVQAGSTVYFHVIKNGCIYAVVQYTASTFEKLWKKATGEEWKGVIKPGRAA